MPIEIEKQKTSAITPAHNGSHSPHVGLCVCFITLGCKVNQTESEAVAQLFRAAGYRVVSGAEEADVVVINTCTVTNVGDGKSRQIIRRMIRKHPESFVVVMGCYAQMAADEVLDIEGVDLVLGTQERGKIIEWIERSKSAGRPQNAVTDIWAVEKFEELPQLGEEQRTRALLKVQDGCNQFCTYCIIPYARGPLRSRHPESALKEARRLVAAGYPEIVLTGIHTGYYGRGLEGTLEQEWNLARLVREMGKIPDLKRLRLSSIEPMEYTEDLIAEIVTSEKVCPHLHVPLQSGSDRILSKMNRPYTLREYRALLELLRQRLPDLAVTTDIIVGFPGETEEDHSAALEFVKACTFARINVFPYSKRKKTPAAAYAQQIPQKVKEQRVKDFLALARTGQGEYSRRFLGKPVEVLVERIDRQGWAIGHTPHYIQVKVPAREAGPPWLPRQLITVILEEGMIGG